MILVMFSKVVADPMRAWGRVQIAVSGSVWYKGGLVKWDSCSA